MRIALPAEVATAAFHRRSSNAAVTRLSGETMGTSWSVLAVGATSHLRDEIERVLARVVADMSHWEATSALSRFNASAVGQWQALPAGFAHVLAVALEIAETSGGAFDPAMGRLADLWGFGPAGPAGFPLDRDLAAILGQSGRRWIEQDRANARRLSDATLDFSGIAKGYAVDAVAAVLLGLELNDFLVEIGGELRGQGIRPDGQPWWVDLEQPAGFQTAPLRIALHDLSVATSGDTQRAFEHDGRRYSHTLDPRTGRPIANGVVSVSVLHASCMMADAWATALTVLGAEGMTLAERSGLAVRMLIEGAAEMLTPRLASMIG